MSNILNPIWRYTYKGFTPPHPTPPHAFCKRPHVAAPAWGEVGRGVSFMGTSPYWKQDIGHLFEYISRGISR